MALQEAIYKAVQEFGKDVLIESRFINILNDYHGFDEIPAARHILKIMQDESRFDVFFKSIDVTDFAISQIVTSLNRKYGFETEQAKAIICAIKMALSAEENQVAASSVQNDVSALNLISNSYEKDDCWIDGNGVIYSQDRQRLIRAPKSLPDNYKINSNTKVICNEAFSLSHITSLDLPEGITHIGDRAFLNRFFLKQISLPSSLLYIGDSVFYKCESLKSIVLPKRLFFIGKNPFVGCYNLTNVQSKSTLFEVINGSLCDSNSLISFIGSNDVCALPSRISTIRDYAFYDNDIIKSIYLPDGITHIGNRSFSWCSKIHNIDLPNNLESIGEKAFSFCENLQTIIIPQNVRIIGDYAFEYCAFTSVNIPSSIEQIGNHAFSGCHKITSVVIPKGTMTNMMRLLPDYLHKKLVEQ